MICHLYPKERASVLYPHLISACAILVALTLGKSPVLAEPDLFRINVVEEESGWPVPMVELQTTHNVRFVSDNAGVIAFDLPELMGIESWFSIEGHGYGVPPDGFGYMGVRLIPEPGGETTVTVRRGLPAKRLGRLTGAGLFGDSQRFGLETEWRESGVLGCDSIQLARHKDKIFWAWGDTNVAKYPLGLFHMTSATTDMAPLDSFEPPLRLQLNYFRDKSGNVRTVAPMPGDGPTWLGGYVSLPDQHGATRLVASYVKIKGFLEAYETGLCVWDDDRQIFEKHLTLWTKSPENPDSPLRPNGHPVFWTDETGKKWVLFGNPFPRVKLEATFEAWENPDAWMELTPQETAPTRDGTGEVIPHGGSICWSEYRNKWVAIFTQLHGSPSLLGEIWYAEADHPTGPWGSAVKVVTHDNYTFYNPRLHPELTPGDSPVLIFEGTFTSLFANNPTPWPRYDYNQVLYRLDLNDPALVVE